MEENFFSSELSSDKKNCFIVFSDKTHVDYILLVLYFIKGCLGKENVHPVSLGEAIRSSEDYLDKAKTLIENCDFGIVIFDGFRPNVVLEMGILIGQDKEVIYIQDDCAELNLKSYYDEEPSQDITGVTPNSFSRLNNPRLDIQRVLSDFGSRHICFIDHNNPDDVIKKISDEISKVPIELRKKEGD